MAIESLNYDAVAEGVFEKLVEDRQIQSTTLNRRVAGMVAFAAEFDDTQMPASWHRQALRFMSVPLSNVRSLEAKPRQDMFVVMQEVSAAIIAANRNEGAEV